MYYEYLRSRPADSFPGWTALRAGSKRNLPAYSLALLGPPAGAKTGSSLRCNDGAGKAADGGVSTGARRGHNPRPQQLYQRQIEAAGQQIDELVYSLYKLAGKEIQIIDNG